MSHMMLGGDRGVELGMMAAHICTERFVLVVHTSTSNWIPMHDTYMSFWWGERDTIASCIWFQLLVTGAGENKQHEKVCT